MIYKYSDFLSKEKLIKEGSSYNPTIIYYNDEMEPLLDTEWYDLKVVKNRPGLYNLIFRIEEKDKNYNYYLVLMNDNMGKNEIYMDNPNNFKEKFKNEFFKKPHEYIENFKFDPKFLGDLKHIRDAGKYNL